MNLLAKEISLSREDVFGEPGSFMASHKVFSVVCCDVFGMSADWRWNIFFLDIIIGCEKWEYKEQAFFGHKSTQLYSKFMQILCCIWQIISAVDTEK